MTELTEFQAHRLRSIVHRILELDAKHEACLAEVAKVYREARAAGVDVPSLKALIRARDLRRRLDAANLAVEQAAKVSAP
jgi:uncharacterized protein (UPF0335 family)